MRAARFTFPSRPLARLALAPAVAAACFAVNGCGQSQADEADAAADMAPVATAPPEMEMAWEERPLGGVASVAAAPVAVKEGAAPLVYLTEQAETIRVVERGGGQILAETPVPARTIVRVDARNGVVAGRRTLVPGPLPAGRRYAILVVPQGENVSRTGTLRERVVEPAEEEVTDRVVDPTGSGTETAEQEPRQ